VPSPEPEGTNIGLIAGIVGGVGGLILLIMLIICIIKCKKRDGQSKYGKEVSIKETE
jgi:hypothetical protein